MHRVDIVLFQTRAAPQIFTQKLLHPRPPACLPLRLLPTRTQMQEWMKSAPEWAQQYSDRLFGAMAEDHRARSFVLAWATCKVLEPLRLVASIAVTPRVARALGRTPSKGFGNDDDEGQGGGGSADAKGDKR